MNIIEPSVEMLDPINGIDILKKIELAGRTCYKSEDKITDESCKAFVANLIKRGHEAMLEHYNLTFKVVCDRGVTHEIVRHRIASYAQESTRYLNYYKKGMTVIKPNFWNYLSIGETGIIETGTLQLSGDIGKLSIWFECMNHCEKAYNDLIALGAKPEEARSVLPNSLKTEIIVTMNLRELRHFCLLRCAKYAHPQMRQVANMLLDQLKTNIPIVFDDIIGEV